MTLELGLGLRSLGALVCILSFADFPLLTTCNVDELISKTTMQIQARFQIVGCIRTPVPNAPVNNYVIRVSSVSVVIQWISKVL